MLGELTGVSSQDALFKGLQGKLPKGVAACVSVLLQAVRFVRRDDLRLEYPRRSSRAPTEPVLPQVVWRASHQAFAGAQSMQPASGPQG